MEVELCPAHTLLQWVVGLQQQHRLLVGNAEVQHTMPSQRAPVNGICV